MYINPLHAIDFYKADHRRQYPKGTNMVYSNFTPRGDRLAYKTSVYDGKVVVFGLQYFIKYFLMEVWVNNFFKKQKEDVVRVYKRRLDNALGKDAVTVEHIGALHDLGYLPIEIRALPEGSKIPLKCPAFTVHSTVDGYFWLTNYIETVMSCMTWKPMTSATIARQYRLLLDKYCDMTGGDEGFVDFQAHDFSFRGMDGIEAAALSGAGHLLSFKGTDTVPALDFLEEYYLADSDEEFIGGSVPATEHSVMCMGSKETEIETFRRLLKLYPTGVVSIVSDTWDLWKVLDVYAPALKAEIEARRGKVVFRPDSGNPVDIICGSPVEMPEKTPENMGCLEVLWKHFGGTKNEKGYRVLNPKVGLIYGDSISLERAEIILTRMEQMGFCSSNIVFGIGSYTYQYNTRDTFGFAMKATYGEVNGEPCELFKDPITDSGEKKSAKGLLAVHEIDGEYVMVDQQTDIDCESELQTVYLNGNLLVNQSLQQIREEIKK